MILTTLLYICVFFSSHVFYVIWGLSVSLPDVAIRASQLIWLSLVGLSFGLLATLCAWPFALSLSTLIEQNRDHRTTQWLITAIRFFASLPLVLFAYLYLEVVGAKVFGVLQVFWVDSFASSNIFTQALAFSLTLVLYPLSLVPGVLPQMTVDIFFKKMLLAVIGFAEVGLVSSVVVLGLTLFVIPQMVLRMLKYLEEDKSRRHHEVIQSLGGTRWESIYMTLLQSMKEHFNIIVAQLTRLCFFEGLVTLSLLSFFAVSDPLAIDQWGASLSALFVSESMNWTASLDKLTLVAAVLSVQYLLFFILERHFRKKLEVIDA